MDIKKLLTHKCYNHDTQREITLLETHISWVILTGHYAYKIKKPVKFNFLNYQNLESRKHFCDLEVQLNSKYHNGIYLKVVPISVNENGNYYCGQIKGKIIEYAVMMNQFDQEVLLSNSLDKGILQTRHFEQLGRDLANFYKGSKKVTAPDSFGDYDSILKCAEDNFIETNCFIGSPFNEKEFNQLKKKTISIIKSKKKLFTKRFTDKRICSCHGDLHVNNLIFEDDKIKVFDCIEFNKEFRYIDPIYDLSFLFLDLIHKNKREFAYALVNSYLEESLDFEGIELLPIYANIRAYVKAKVSCFIYKDFKANNNPLYSSKREEALDYFKLSLEMINNKYPRVFITSGISGTGKTTIASHFSKKTEAIHIRSDVIRKYLAGISTDTKGDPHIYSEEFSLKTYGTLFELLKIYSKNGLNVIIDGKYDQFSLRRPIEDFCKREKFSFKILHAHANIDLIKSRIISRKGDASDATIDLINTQINNFEDFNSFERNYLIRVDTSKDWKNLDV